MDLLADAITFAAKHHAGQTDRAGVPYIAHICAVVAGVDSNEARIVAAVHDVVEDTDVTLEDVEDAFGVSVRNSVDHLTKRDGEGYGEYIKRVCESEVAMEVKLSDLKHNMDLTRLGKVTRKDVAMRSKYVWAEGEIWGTMMNSKQTIGEMK